MGRLQQNKKLIQQKSGEENDFIASLSPKDNWRIWLGFNDVDEENKFVDDKGLPMSWKNWISEWGEPNGSKNGIGDEGWFIFMSGIIYQLNLFIYICYQIKIDY